MGPFHRNNRPLSILKMGQPKRTFADPKSSASLTSDTFSGPFLAGDAKKKLPRFKAIIVFCKLGKTVKGEVRMSL